MTTKFVLGLGLWGVVLSGTLSIATLPGDWGHSVCGAWGCGPPVQALVAWHLSWLVVVAPLAGFIGLRCAEGFRLRVAAGMAVLSLVGVLGVAFHELLVWYPSAAEFQRHYLMHRIGFQVLTLIELPILALMPAALLLIAPFWNVRPSLIPDGGDTRASSHSAAAQA